MSIARLLTIASAAVFLTPNVVVADANLALVIGLRDYVYLRPLKRSSNDAQDVSALFSSRHYRVTTVSGSASKGTLLQALKTLRSQIKIEKDRGPVNVVIYYSGHGFEAYGGNWLVGTDFEPQSKPISGKALFKQFGLNLNDVITDLRKSGASRTIIVLDACREPSVEVGPRKYVSPGFDIATSEVPYSFFLFYASARQSIAYDSEPGDSSARNSVFTKHFLQYAQQNMEVSALGNLVQKSVYSATLSRKPPQLPSLYDQIPGDAYLFGQIKSQSIVDAVPAVPIYFTDKRLSEAQQIGGKLKDADYGYALVADDFSQIRSPLPNGEARIVTLGILTKIDRKRLEDVKRAVMLVTGRMPSLITVRPENLINKPFQVQLF